MIKASNGNIVKNPNSAQPRGRKKLVGAQTGSKKNSSRFGGSNAIKTTLGGAKPAKQIAPGVGVVKNQYTGIYAPGANPTAVR